MRPERIIAGISVGACPCCGGALSVAQGVVFRPESRALVSSAYAVIFTPNQSRIFKLFWENRNRGRVITRPMMLHELYSLDPDGGAEDKIIDVMISKIRKHLALTDLEIITIGGGYVLRSKLA